MPVRHTESQSQRSGGVQEEFGPDSRDGVGLQHTSLEVLEVMLQRLF